MATSEDLELLYKTAKSLGYKNFRNGRFATQSAGSSANFDTLAKKLGLEHVLLSLDNKGPYIAFKANLSEVRQYFVDREKEIRDSKEAEGGGLFYDSSKKLMAALKTHTLYKTYKDMGDYDEGHRKSLGFSVIAFNPETQALVAPDIRVDAYLAVRDIKRADVPLNPDIRHVWPVFNPFTAELHFPITLEDVGEIDALNLAIPPNWLKKLKPTTKPEFSGFIHRLIHHLFPDEEDRERVLDWCHYAVTRRNGTMLCLVGARGSGKTTFVLILAKLVGNRYFTIAPESVLTDKFNSVFKNKRLVAFEEVAIVDNSSINKVKAWCNHIISIEEKGVDHALAENYSSMVLLINNRMELKIAPQERRFSVPRVTDDDLKEEFSQEELTQFNEGLNHEEEWMMDEIGKFGLFLQQRVPKYSNEVPIKNEAFFEQAEMSLTEWQRGLRDYILDHANEDVILILDAMPKLLADEDTKQKERIPKKNKIIEFLKDYKYRGEFVLGKKVELSWDEMQKHSRTNVSNANTDKKKKDLRAHTWGIIPHASLKPKDEDLL